MEKEKYNFQFCPKLVIFSQDRKSVFLCKRKGEQDYDGTFSFIGGKMEAKDSGIVAGIVREKNEEVGENFKIKLYPNYSVNVFYVKKDGSRMVLPHYAAIYSGGNVQLSEEYSEYKWVAISELESFEPKIETIYDSVSKMQELLKISDEANFIEM